MPIPEVVDPISINSKDPIPTENSSSSVRNEREDRSDDLNSKPSSESSESASVPDNTGLPIVPKPDIGLPRAGRRKNRNGSEEKSRINMAIDLAKELQLFFFHTPEGEAFASLPVHDHRETFALEDRSFENFFASTFYAKEKVNLPKKDFVEVRSIFIGEALYKGPEKRVHIRLAEKDGFIYLDLGNKEWEMVRVSKNGWEITKTAPVIFRRVRGMKSLPRPTKGGSIEDLRPYINVTDEKSWVLVIAFLIAALRPVGPYPILAIEGEQGSAKSTTSEVLRRLIDPSTAPLRSAPRDERDLIISASNSACLAFENLSSVPPWLSDALCRMATGSGFSTRRLYSDADEKLFDAARPVILNGIHIGISNGDLFDRSLIVRAPAISEQTRRTEAEFWREFDKGQPGILGALLDAVACALGRIATLKLPTLPRMADFAAWATAAEPALGWRDGTFLDAYSTNRQAASELSLENSPLLGPIENLLRERESWEGTASMLLVLLLEFARTDHLPMKNWPGSAGSLSGMLRRLRPSLKAVGIHLEFDQTSGRNSKKIIRLTRDLGGENSGH